MLVIFEGPDNSGKSTLMSEVAMQLADIPIKFHSMRFGMDERLWTEKEYLGVIDDVYDSIADRHVVLWDRSFYSSAPYALVHGTERPWTDNGIAACELRLEQFEPIVVQNSLTFGTAARACNPQDDPAHAYSYDATKAVDVAVAYQNMKPRLETMPGVLRDRRTDAEFIAAQAARKVAPQVERKVTEIVRRIKARQWFITERLETAGQVYPRLKCDAGYSGRDASMLIVGDVDTPWATDADPRARNSAAWLADFVGDWNERTGCRDTALTSCTHVMGAIEWYRPRIILCFGNATSEITMAAAESLDYAGWIGRTVGLHRVGVLDPFYQRTVHDQIIALASHADMAGRHWRI